MSMGCLRDMQGGGGKCEMDDGAQAGGWGLL